MDFATVFSRGNKLAAAICALIVATFFGANFVLERLSAASDKIRVEQLALANFRAQLNLIPGSINAMQLGEDTVEAGELNEKAARSVNAVQTLSSAPNFPISRESVTKYLDVARREMKAISVQQSAEASEIRRNEANPAYRVINIQLEEQNDLYAEKAGQFRRRSQVIKDITFTISGLLIVAIVIGFQRIGTADTLRERARHSQEISGLRFAALVQNSTDVILLTSRKGVVTLVNDACRGAWDVSPQSCTGKHITSLFNSADVNNLIESFESSLNKPNADVETTMRIEVRPNVVHYFQVHIRNLMNNVHIGGVVITFHDITDRAAFEEELTHQASHDRLTGLPNRSLMMVRLTEALKRAKISNEHVAALFIDLDNFKTINDTLGHEMGDLLLVNVAKRIQSTVRPSDTAARLGGDEFVIVLDNAGGPEKGETIARRIVEQFMVPFRLGNDEIMVTASIGIATSISPNEEPNDLLRKADTAMYHAKHKGKSGYAVFDDLMTIQANQTEDDGADLKVAVKEKKLDLLFQPIVNLDSQTMVEVEAFVRWLHRTTGTLDQPRLIPMLEKQGLLTSVEHWMLAEICQQLNRWNSIVEAGPGIGARITITQSQWLRPDFANSVANVLREFGVQPDRLNLAVSEHDVLNDLDHSRSVCRVLNEIGVRVSIDHFGIGERTMDYLKDLPVTSIKIDPAITMQLGEDQSADRIVRAIVETSHSHGMKVAADRITSTEQLHMVKEFGLDLGQGALISRPLDPSDLSRQLMQLKPSVAGRIM